MSETIQERPGVKRDCACVAAMNDALKRTSPGVRVRADIFTRRPAVATVRVEGKGSMPILFASFCPFCGVKFED